MGMSTNMKAFVNPNNETFKKHKKVYFACKEAGISLPKETAEYFGTKDPEDDSVLDDKLEIDLKLGVHYEEYKEDMIEGFEVDLTKLPKDVHTIRFYNSY